VRGYELCRQPLGVVAHFDRPYLVQRFPDVRGFIAQAHHSPHKAVQVIGDLAPPPRFFRHAQRILDARLALVQPEKAGHAARISAAQIKACG
jgi:uncharacterized heparinase superfamily protein